MSAGYYDIYADQGASWGLTVVCKQPNGNPMDLTGWSARLQVRSTVSDPIILTEINSTGLGGITVAASTGTLSLSMTDEQTAVLPAGGCVYDLLIESPADYAVRLLKGKFVIDEAVTR